MSQHAATQADRRVEHVLHYVVALGAMLVMLLPAARGFSDTFGWMPLWLLAMPLSAWWALHRFRMPASRQPRGVAAPVRRRRPGTQARRRALPARRIATARAA
ncbi:hypothetical protein [Lysobacter niastensis]|uniref:Transmembrane protein n=1 Tax=Lysobacter niastensis TaxID=380629 RepID=A0ABS0BA79_9GAMM|nr:hypothetical protein [Lysobacter niastensis]MBF6025188.1 hypothetical protein [Lysobacter niastensis]